MEILFSTPITMRRTFLIANVLYFISQFGKKKTYALYFNKTIIPLLYMRENAVEYMLE